MLSVESRRPVRDKTLFFSLESFPIRTFDDSVLIAVGNKTLSPSALRPPWKVDTLFPLVGRNRRSKFAAVFRPVLPLFPCIKRNKTPFLGLYLAHALLSLRRCDDESLLFLLSFRPYPTSTALSRSESGRSFLENMYSFLLDDPRGLQSSHGHV